MAVIILISDLPELQTILIQAMSEWGTAVDRIQESQLDQLKNRSCDLIAIDFTKKMLNECRYKIIFDIKCRNKAPVLAILEEGTTRHKLTLLNFGADDYIDMQEDQIKLSLKIEQLLRQKRVMEQIEIRNNSGETRYCESRR